ncbi:beta-carotene 15,15'-monooxygenase [Ureibacillus sp. NPDC094379]
MQLVQNVKQHVWLYLLILVLGSNMMLYRSEFGVNLLQRETNGVVLGSLIDLVIISPILYLAWKRQKSIKLFVILMASGLVLARLLIPIEYIKPFVAITWVGFAVEGGLLLLELLLLVTLFRFMPKIVRLTKESSIPLLFAFSEAVDRYLQKHQLIQIICSEMLMFYYAFVSWRKKTIQSDKTITLHKNSSYISFQVMLIHAIVVETLGIHWFLNERTPILSIILLLLNIYTVIFLLADIQAVRLNPLQFDEKRVFVSLGLLKRIDFYWSEVEEVVLDQQILKQKHSKGTLDFVARDFEEVFPNVILKFKEPKEATLLMGIKKTYKQVAIRLDNLQKFKEILEQKNLL